MMASSFSFPHVLLRYFIKKLFWLFFPFVLSSSFTQSHMWNTFLNHKYVLSMVLFAHRVQPRLLLFKVNCYLCQGPKGWKRTQSILLTIWPNSPRMRPLPPSGHFSCLSVAPRADNCIFVCTCSAQLFSSQHPTHSLLKPWSSYAYFKFPQGEVVISYVVSPKFFYFPLLQQMFLWYCNH